MAGDLVSIVIPCFNYGRYLGDAVRSALAQTYRPIEILVIDDGSTDATPVVARSFGGSVRYFSKPNGGLSSARNFGSRRCKGTYIAFLDADDELVPTFVERTLGVLADNPTSSFVYTQVEYFGRREGVSNFPPFDLHRLTRRNYISATAMMRASLFNSYCYDETFTRGLEDWDFYLTLAGDSHLGVLCDEPLVRYRKHRDSLSMIDRLDSDGSVRYREYRRLTRKHRQLFPWWWPLRTAASYSRWHVMRRLGRTLEEDGLPAVAPNDAANGPADYPEIKNE